MEVLPQGLSRRADGALRYSYRARVMSRPQMFTLTDDALTVDDGHRALTLKLRDIVRVRLSYRPSNFLSPRFVCTLDGTGGERLRLCNVSWAGLAGLEVQNAAFSAFVRALHAALAKAGAQTQFLRGEALWRYGFVLALSVLPLGALVVFGVMAMQEGLRGTVLAVAVFLAVLLWPTALHAKLNRPGDYSPDALPGELVPE